MLLGVVNGAGQKWSEALATFLLVLTINILMLLPKQRLPTEEEWYVAIVQGILTALIIYAINKGIAWKQEK